MILQSKHYSFSLKLIPTLATLVYLPIFILLGIWQIQRAEEKQIIVSNYETHRHAAPINIDQLVTKKNINYTAVKITGHFDNAHQFLLDNKFYQHQLGYQVITPFVMSNHKTVLINRGWISQGPSRAQLPVIPSVQNEMTIEGIVNIPVKSFSLGNNTETSQWPKRINEIDIAQLAKKTGDDFYPFIILLDPASPNGFAREWAPLHVNPAKSYAYAFQWFAFAVSLLVIYIALNTKKKKNMD
jgi:surfeit locus 1 family protein